VGKVIWNTAQRTVPRVQWSSIQSLCKQERQQLNKIADAQDRCGRHGLAWRGTEPYKRTPQPSRCSAPTHSGTHVLQGCHTSTTNQPSNPRRASLVVIPINRSVQFLSFGHCCVPRSVPMHAFVYLPHLKQCQSRADLVPEGLQHVMHSSQ
jgi:hypothetical protein